jgi:hypothetical protein
MVTEYDAYMADQVVGVVTVERQGLYYCFDCRCRLPAGSLCRMVAEQGLRREKLGILVPQGGVFCLKAKLAIKRFGEGEFLFRVLPKYPTGLGFFAPVYPDEPFKYISRLKSAFLEIRNGQLGVFIKAPESSQPDNDLNP